MAVQAIIKKVISWPPFLHNTPHLNKRSLIKCMQVKMVMLGMILLEQYCILNNQLKKGYYHSSLHMHLYLYWKQPVYFYYGSFHKLGLGIKQDIWKANKFY
jgi:hypothetical protein